MSNGESIFNLQMDIHLLDPQNPTRNMNFHQADARLVSKQSTVRAAKSSQTPTGETGTGTWTERSHLSQAPS